MVVNLFRVRNAVQQIEPCTIHLFLEYHRKINTFRGLSGGADGAAGKGSRRGGVEGAAAWPGRSARRYLAGVVGAVGQAGAGGGAGVADEVGASKAGAVGAPGTMEHCIAWSARAAGMMQWYLSGQWIGPGQTREVGAAGIHRAVREAGRRGRQVQPRSLPSAPGRGGTVLAAGKAGAGGAVRKPQDSPANPGQWFAERSRAHGLWRSLRKPLARASLPKQQCTSEFSGGGRGGSAGG
jgi:hypothetical protein